MAQGSPRLSRSLHVVECRNGTTLNKLSLILVSLGPLVTESLADLTAWFEGTQYAVPKLIMKDPRVSRLAANPILT